MCKKNQFKSVCLVLVLMLLTCFGTGCRQTAENTESEVPVTVNEKNFYEKLAAKEKVSVLIVGDSIGAQNWPAAVTDYLAEAYGVETEFENVSMGGNASYAGYARVMALQDGVDYDLAVICYGQNDGENGFGRAYESIVRALRARYNDCVLLSVLESAQRTFTPKMEIIRQIAAHYDILVADTITPFNDGTYGEYDTLTADGCHPNSAGEEVYATVVEKVLDEAIQAGTAVNTAAVDALFEGNEYFDEFMSLDLSKFEQNGLSFIYKTDKPLSGLIGLDYMYHPGANSCTVLVDGVEFQALDFDWSYDFSQRHIRSVGAPTEIKQSLEFRFADQAQAEGFNGAFLSW